MFTVLGGKGFIGSRLVMHLRAAGHKCFVPTREEILKLGRELGHVIYCIGLTADFRHRTFDTMEVHVGLLSSFLRRSEYESFLYLSSARIYQSCALGEETAVVTVNPANPSDLYNISKLAGESLCLTLERPNVRVARLSNVYSPDLHSENFLTSVITDAVRKRHVRLRTSRDSEKDYVPSNALNSCTCQKRVTLIW